MTIRSHLREFQDGPSGHSRLIDGGTVRLVRHGGSPVFFHEAEPYRTERLRQAQVAAWRHGKLPASTVKRPALYFARRLQPFGADLPSREPSHALVASLTGRLSEALLLDEASLPRPVSRSRSPAVRRASLRRERGTRQRLDLPPFSLSPCGLLADAAASANVPPQLCGLRRSCGRTAVPGHASRLPVRLAPAGRRAAGISISVLLRECGACSCVLCTRRESPIKPKSAATSCRAVQDVAQAPSEQLGNRCFRSRLRKSSPLAPACQSALPIISFQANANRAPAPSLRSLSRSPQNGSDA